MAKKRAKSKLKAASKTQSKKSKAPIQQKAQIDDKPAPLKNALRELEILAEEKKVEQKVENIEKKEENIEKKELEIEKEEKKLEKEAGRMESIEKKISREVADKPLRAFNLKDLNKGIVGAFIGVVAHFGFIYGKAIATLISTWRATLLLAFSYLLIVILMYETGYRDIKEKRLFGFLPKRATIIYATSLVVVVIIFFLFNMIDLSAPLDLYKQIAVTSILASVGAGTADLLGKH